MGKTRKVVLRCGKESLELPVTPKDIEIAFPQMNKKTELLGGEANVHGKRGVDTTTLSSFFPDPSSPHYYLAKMSPQKYIDKIIKFKTGTKVIRLIVTGGGTNINIAILIDNFTTRYTEGSKDVFYNIEISENPKFNVSSKSSSKKAGKNGLKTRVGARSRPKKYKVKKNDTIRKLAKRYYGNVSSWKKIYKANKGKMKPPKYTLKKGTTLSFP